MCSSPGALASQVALRNGSLVVQNATCEFREREMAARDAVLTAAALNTTGQMLRSEFAQAYLCLDGLSLCNGLSGVLESRSTIEANNSYLLAGPGTTYESLELNLRHNNTLLLDTGDVVTFHRSTVTLGANNWVYVTNGSTVHFNGSVLNFSNYIAWSTEDSTVSSVYAVLEFNDVVLFGNRSRWGFVNSTWVVQSTGVNPPGDYKDVIGPLLWMEDSDIAIQGTLAKWSNVSALLANTSLLLVNSTLQLENTTLELWGSPLGLINSRIVLSGGSQINFYCGSTTVFEGTVTSTSFSISSNAGAAPEVGLPLGVTDADVVEEPNGTVELAAPSVQVATTPGATTPGATAAGSAAGGSGA
ncbi:hypothetical protein Vafri_10561 [Volvox africanus]|nr:hypothetical protein Vafri_10561 [Volvox africanus]